MSDATKPEAHDGQSSTDEKATIEQAQRFLEDETVRSSTREKKVEFLKGKGFSDGDIQSLLGQESQPETSPDTEKQTNSEAPSSAPTEAPTEARPTSSQSTSSSTTSDAPPIITYPEFLTHSPRPPPLVTPDLVLKILTVSGTALTFLYGGARFVVKPMVDTLNESRSEYYGHVGAKLTPLLEKLESMASEVPYQKGKPLNKLAHDHDDASSNSSYDDPTELFHRDFGTQTSPQIPIATPAPGPEKPVDVQARQLERLSSSLKELADMYTKKTENTADLHNSLREVRDSLDKVVYPPMPDYTSLYGGPSFGRSAESDDEFKKTKDAIRSVKGLLLSSRRFPAATTSAR